MALSKKVKIGLGVAAAAVVAFFVFKKRTPGGGGGGGNGGSTAYVDANGLAWALNPSDFLEPYGYMITANGASSGGRAVSLAIVNGRIVATNGQGINYTWANSTWQQI